MNINNITSNEKTNTQNRNQQDNATFDEVENIFISTTDKFKNKNVQKVSVGASGFFATTLLASILTKNAKGIKYSSAGLIGALGSYGLSKIDISSPKTEQVTEENIVEEEEKIISYDIKTYFNNNKIKETAYYIDQKVGNNNGMLDEAEINDFQKVIGHKFNKLEYDFDTQEEFQIENLKKNYDEISGSLYDITGPRKLGKSISNVLYGKTDDSEYSKISKLLHKIEEFPILKERNNVVKSFISGYYAGDAKEGFFEQLGSEYGSTITNNDIANFLKVILKVTEENNQTKEWKTVQKEYTNYSQKPQQEIFKTPEFFRNFLTGNSLKDLDTSIKILLDIT